MLLSQFSKVAENEFTSWGHGSRMGQKSLTCVVDDGPASTVTPVASLVNWDSSIFSSTFTFVSGRCPFTPFTSGCMLDGGAVCDLDFILDVFLPVLLFDFRAGVSCGCGWDTWVARGLSSSSSSSSSSASLSDERDNRRLFVGGSSPSLNTEDLGE